MGEGGFGLVVPDADLPADGLEAAYFPMLTPPAVGRGRECFSARCGRPVARARRGRRTRPVRAGSPHRGRLRSERRVGRRPDRKTSPASPRRPPPEGRTGRAKKRLLPARRRRRDNSPSLRGRRRRDRGGGRVAPLRPDRGCPGATGASARGNVVFGTHATGERRRGAAPAVRLGRGGWEGWRQRRLRTRTSSAACRCGPGGRTTKQSSRRAARRRG